MAEVWESLGAVLQKPATNPTLIDCTEVCGRRTRLAHRFRRVALASLLDFLFHSLAILPLARTRQTYTR